MISLLCLEKKKEKEKKVCKKTGRGYIHVYNNKIILLKGYLQQDVGNNTCLMNLFVCVQVCAHRPALLSGVPEGQAAQRSAAVLVRVKGQYTFLYHHLIFLDSMSGGYFYWFLAVYDLSWVHMVKPNIHFMLVIYRVSVDYKWKSIIMVNNEWKIFKLVQGKWGEKSKWSKVFYELLIYKTNKWKWNKLYRQDKYSSVAFAEHLSLKTLM